MIDSYGTRSLREIVRILFQHWLLLFFIVAVGTGGTYALCKYYAPRVYRSEVSLIYQRPMNRSPISTDQSTRPLEVFVKAQQQILMSDLVLARTKVIAESPELREKWYSLRDKWEKARDVGGDRLSRAQDDIKRFLDAKIAKVLPAVDELLSSGQRELDEFRDEIQLETPGGEQVAMTESFTVMVDQKTKPGQSDGYLNAKYAADILADMYMLRYQDLQEELSTPALQVMRDVIDEFKEELDAKSHAYGVFVQENANDIGVLEQLLKSGTPHGIQVVNTEVRKNNAQLALELARDKAIHGVLDRLLPETARKPSGIADMTRDEVETTLSSIPFEFLKDNVKFSELLKEMAKLEAKRAKVETQYTEVSRNVQYIREQLERSQRQLLRAMVAHASGLAASIEVREQQQAENETLVQATAEEQSGIHRKLAQYAKLKNEFEVAQKHLEALEKEKMEAVANRVRASDALLISKLNEASTPRADRPVSPKTMLFTIVAFLVSVLLSVAGAFMADHFDHTLRSSGEAERYLGVPVLGSVKKRGRRLLLPT